MSYYDIAVSLNIHSLLTYTSEENIEPGTVVLVEVGNKKVKGVVVEKRQKAPGDFTVKPIIEIFPYRIPPHHVELMKWLHEYYLGGWDSILRMFLPPGELRREALKVRLKKIEDLPRDEIVDYLISRGKRWTALSTLKRKFGDRFRRIITTLINLDALEIKEVRKNVKEKEVVFEEFEDLFIPHVPTDEQRKALEAINPFIDQTRFKTFLIHGVTGSGKTALYLWLTSRAIKNGKSVYILVPEIALSHQVSAYFKKVFSEKVGIYHSNLTPGERRWLWNRALYGDIKILVGPRSSLFIPLKSPGLIVVDEEHDTSYKEERAPFYHARDVAVVLGKILGIPVVLGSATPSVESYFNALKGKYGLIKLKKRIRGYYMPQVEVVDMREEKSDSILSIKMMEELKSVISSNRQAILFLNRRGFSHHIQCQDCGHIEKCPHCSVSLVFHKSSKTLKCHLCGYTKKVPDRCPVCGSYRLKPIGVGTERVEEELKKFFPPEIIVRMDLDTTRKKGAHGRIYRDFLMGKKKILIGTQMVTKGFDFPRVGFVGVVLADTTLAIPDFRAEEFTYQLISQVTGRSRRGGKVIIQTYSPEDVAISTGAKGSYEEFFKKELESRKLFGYPPFKRIAIIEVKSRSRESASREIAKIASKLVEIEQDDVENVGPAPSPIERLMGYYRFRVLLKSEKPFAIQHLIKKSGLHEKAGRNLEINIDPLSFF